jgi:hypothetical protein
LNPHHVPVSTHRCTVCGSWWILNPARTDYPSDHPFSHPTWTLSKGTVTDEAYPLGRAGRCCDNVPMGDQIEAIP